MLSKKDTPSETLQILKTGYSGDPKDQNENIMITVQSLISHTIGQSFDKKVIDETLSAIHRISEFQQVAIVLRDSDGYFRFKGSLGLPNDAYSSIQYSDADMSDQSTYPSTDVSELTKFFMQENTPYRKEETNTYAKPYLLHQERANPDDMLEGDYINVHIYDLNKKMIGYLELSNSRSKKLPVRNMIRWMELIAMVIGVILSKKSK